MSKDVPPKVTARQPPTEARGKGDKPPKRGPGRPPGGANVSDIEKTLNQYIAVLGMAFMARGDAHCANHVVENGPGLAAAWTDMARKNKAVRETLLKLTTGGAWGQVSFATAMFIVPLMQHHGLYPKTWPSPVVLPDEYEAGDDREPINANTDAQPGGTPMPPK